ncbi:hypothetical protein HanPSC8_Chr07g0269851 [Helianthus annuus]|nr:hypothetical protein HanPSC8_Chr07g0269851 [Helianthus annuus]
MDLKQKLDGKFPKEFDEPPKEYTADEIAQMDKKHEEAIDRYIQNPPRTTNQKKKQKEVIMRNVGAERDFGYQDQLDRYVVTTENDTFDVYGNSSGIVSWVYNDDKGMFLVKRKNGAVEYYNHCNAFESWTTVDLRELSQAPYHDQYRDHNCKIGWNFYNKLQKQTQVNFRDMKLAQSFVVEHEDVIDPSTNTPFKTVMWPPINQINSVPLLKELLDNSLKDLQFWMYDPVTGQAVIVCANEEYRVTDVKDLMRFGENDIKLLGRTQIRSDPRCEVYAKNFTSAIAHITLLKLWSGQRSRVETQLFGPYVGRHLPNTQKKQKKKRK